MFQTVHSGSQKAFDKHSSSCLSDELLQDCGCFLADSRPLQSPANWPLRSTWQANLPDPSQWNKLRASCWHSFTILCQLFLPRDASPFETEKGAPSHIIYMNSWRFAVLCGQRKDSNTKHWGLNRLSSLLVLSPLLGITQSWNRAE